MSNIEWQHILDQAEPCRLGLHEYDMARYCHEHGGFIVYMSGRTVCDRHPINNAPGWKEHVDAAAASGSGAQRGLVRHHNEHHRKEGHGAHAGAVRAP